MGLAATRNIELAPGVADPVGKLQLIVTVEQPIAGVEGLGRFRGGLVVHSHSFNLGSHTQRSTSVFGLPTSRSPSAVLARLNATYNIPALLKNGSRMLTCTRSRLSPWLLCTVDAYATRKG